MSVVTHKRVQITSPWVFENSYDLLFIIERDVFNDILNEHFFFVYSV